MRVQEREKDARRVDRHGENFEREHNSIAHHQRLYRRRIEPTPRTNIVQNHQSRIDRGGIINREGEVNGRVGVGRDDDIGKSTAAERCSGSGGVEGRSGDLLERGTEDCRAHPNNQFLCLFCSIDRINTHNWD